MHVFAATGHRPDKLGGHNKETSQRLFRTAYEYLKNTRPKEVISGMALGWDTSWAEAAIELGIPFTAAIPFEGQETIWPESAQKHYWWVKNKAAKVVVVCEGGYAPAKMQIRNEWMVDNSTALITLWNGSSGGTANCVRYAQLKKRRMKNLWQEFQCQSI